MTDINVVGLHEPEADAVELGIITGIIKSIFYLTRHGTLARWDSQKHPRDKNGRFIKAGAGAYIYGRNERAVFGGPAGANGLRVDLDPGDRVYLVGTGSRIVQHADGTGDYYINSNPGRKMVLNAKGVQNILQTKIGEDKPKLEKSVPGIMVQGNNEREAESALSDGSDSRVPKRSNTAESPDLRPAVSKRENSAAGRKTSGVLESRQHPKTKFNVDIRVPEGSTVHETAKGFVVEHSDGTGTVYEAKTGYAREVKQARAELTKDADTKTHKEEYRRSRPRRISIKHPESETGKVSVRWKAGDSLILVKKGVIVENPETGGGHFYPHDKSKSDVAVSAQGLDKFVKRQGDLIDGDKAILESADVERILQDQRTEREQPSKQQAEAAATSALARYRRTAEDREKPKSSQNEKPKSDTETPKLKEVEHELSHATLGHIRVRLEPGAKVYEAENGFIVVRPNGQADLYNDKGKVVRAGLSTSDIQALPFIARMSLRGRVSEFDKDKKITKSTDYGQKSTKPKVENQKFGGKPEGTPAALEGDTIEGRSVVYLPEDERKQVIAALKAAGITEIDGIPIEDKFKVRK